MSRRSRSPGPIRDSDASPKGTFRNSFKSNWISVNPCPGGVLPTDVATLGSSDPDNGTPGVWYHADPNSVFDISGHASDWVARDANGVEFYCDLAAMKDQEIDNVEQTSGKLATALTKPDGTGILEFSDLVGCTIEFLVEAHENCPNNENHDTGILVGLSSEKFLTVTGDGHGYCLGLFYQGTADANPLKMGVHAYNPHGLTTTLNTVSDCKVGWAQFHFVQKSATEVVCATSVALSLKDDYTMTHHNNQTYMQQKAGDPMAMDDKAYLVIAPFARDNSGGGSAVRRTGKFKLWYRLLFSEDEFEPTYDPNSNNRQGS